MSTISNNLKLSLVTSFLKVYSGSITFMILAKLMVVSDFGVLTFGFSLSLIAAASAEFGFSLMAMRDIPQKRFDRDSYVFNSLVQKAGISFIILIIGIVYLYYLYEDLNIYIGIIFLFYAIVLSFTNYFLAVFKAENNFKVETITVVFNAVLITVLVVAYFFEHYEIVKFSLLLLGIRFFQLAWVIKKYYTLYSFKYKLNRQIQNYFLKNSWSFGLHFIIGTFYFTVDTQFIAFFHGNESVALYQSVFRIILIFLLFVDIITQVFLPHLSVKYLNSDKKDIEYLCSVLLKSLLSLSLLIFIFFTTFSSWILEILYTTKYIKAISVVLPLSIVVILRACGSLYGLILTISDNQIIRLKSVTISLIFSLCLNFYLVPKYGINGAAWASVASNGIVLLLYIYYTWTAHKYVFTKLSMLWILIIAVILYYIIQYYNWLNFSWEALIVMLFWLGVISLFIGKNNFLNIKSLLKEKR